MQNCAECFHVVLLKAEKRRCHVGAVRAALKPLAGCCVTTRWALGSRTARLPARQPSTAGWEGAPRHGKSCDTERRDRSWIKRA